MFFPVKIVLSHKMKSKKILILGASSDIGLKTIDLYLNKGWKVFCHYNQNSKKLLTLKKVKKNIQLIQLNFKTQNNLEKKN